MSSSAVLYYFTGRGKAEIIRLTMAATGVDWNQVNVSNKQDFENLKSDGKLFFGQLPLVEFEGNRMVQTNATVRFFARRGNLMGQTAEESFKIDMLFEGTRDFNSYFMQYGFGGYEPILQKAKELALPRYLPIFNKALADNGSNGFLVGSKLTLADIGLLEPVLSVEELMGADELAPYAEIQKFLGAMKSNERIASYLSSKRPRKNDDAYVNEVRSTIF